MSIKSTLTSKHCLHACIKVNLALYDCDVLVVTGTSYFLWVMDNLKEISAEVARIWEEDHKKEEEEEEGQEDRSRQETDTIGSDSKCCELEYNKVRHCDLEMLTSILFCILHFSCRIECRTLTGRS